MNGKLKFILPLLSIFICLSSSCKIREKKPQYSEDTIYETNVTQADCHLCGSNPDSPFSSYWGQANIGLFNLNTMDVFVCEVNRYDESGLLVPKIERHPSHRGFMWNDKAGSTVQYNYNTSRGFIEISISLNENSMLNIDNLTRNYCTNCLSTIMNERLHKGETFDVALVAFQSKEIRLFDKQVTGYFLNDYNINCTYNRENNSYQINASYSPVRYSELAYNPDETVMEQVVNQCAKKNITLVPDDKLSKFIDNIKKIDGLSIYEESIEFRSGFNSLYVFGDGTYDILDLDDLAQGK